MQNTVAVAEMQDWNYIVAYTSEWKKIIDDTWKAKEVIEVNVDLEQLGKMRIQEIKVWAKEQFNNLH